MPQERTGRVFRVPAKAKGGATGSAPKSRRQLTDRLRRRRCVRGRMVTVR